MLCLTAIEMGWWLVASQGAAPESANPPPLVSPAAGLVVRAVLDQDASLTAGLAVDSDGKRVVLLVSALQVRPGEREEFTQWAGALDSIGSVARVARVADYGHTTDGRPYLATYTDRSLADMMRRVGPPERRYVRDIGVTIADALAATHSYGLVHGAVSPATVLLVHDGARLGGFGATAPGLTGSLGVWAFTAPEHRVAAAAGDVVGSPAGDVFALAATICVALAGVLPWSDPVSWADAADVPSGPDAPGWASAIRAALAADPDQRPTAEDMANALRAPVTTPMSKNTAVPMDASMARAVAGGGGAGKPSIDRPAVKVDLRGLIPRQVRRLAAQSVDAMADGRSQVVGRAAPAEAGAPPAAETSPDNPVDEPLAVPAPRRAGRIRQLMRSHRRASGAIGAVAALAIGSAIYFSGGPNARSASAPKANTGAGAAADAATLAMLDGARQAGQAFLHNIGVRSDIACLDVHGAEVVTVGGPGHPMTCATLLANAKGLLGQATLDKMSEATVLQAVNFPTAGNNGPADPDPHAFISLSYVPSLKKALNKLELVLTFHAGQWWIVQVTFA